MLKRLHADNYRCLVGFEFKPSAKQLVIGRNGTGKTAALEVLAAIRDFSSRGVPFDERLGGSTLTRWRPEVETQRFELDVRLDGADYRYELAVEDHPLHTPRLFRVNRESVTYDGKPVFVFEDGTVHLFNDRFEDKAQYPFDWTRSALATVQERRENTKLTAFRRWLRRLVHVQINPWRMSSRSEQEAPELALDASNFSSWYRHLLLDDARSVHEALAALQAVVPGLEGLDAKEAGLNVRVLRASIRTGDKVGSYPIGELSDGPRALIVLYVLLHCALKDGACLLIDEPDNFLALAEIQPWLMSMLDRIDAEHAQVILTSHHPEILNQMATQGGVLFERADGGVTSVRAFDPGADTGLTPSEIVSRGWESA